MAADAVGYEQARDELADVVRRLESGGTTLEESLALWERGEQLAQICQEWLDGARKRLDAAVAAAPQGPNEAGEVNQDAASGRGSPTPPTPPSR
ncbi:hypothetical protein BH24ACT13_BH24ACT13_04950 [soil metagenome]